MEKLSLYNYEFNKDSVFEQYFDDVFRKRNKETLWNINGIDMLLKPMEKLATIWRIGRKMNVGFYEANTAVGQITDAKFIMIEWNHPGCPKTASQQIGDQLVKLRQLAGMKQADLIKVSGMTPTRIVELENGRTDYKIGTLVKYLKSVGANISDLKINWSVLREFE